MSIHHLLNRRVVLGALLCLAPLGCAWNRVEGTVTVEGTKVGTWTQPFVGCRSGWHEEFLGADLFGNGIRMRVVRDATRGPVLQLFDPSINTLLEVTREVCSTLDVQVARGVNDSPLVEGSARFSCTPKTGGTLTGSLSFRCE